ncbi:type I-E CRISPR-associated protein Cas5/CasD [Ferrovum sp.]|uniref:type I-E CRISPR-associated protein Cas5/CasD n=1 Tax=Ferrovum sp. TaxID=2609467 RepID=UPI002636FDB8|nr:type I-E CRISPR-associated protein Cas5/CasD [Ferrovum sp.]
MQAVAFEIATPMASWAVGGSSHVPTQTTPTWSAIVGMLGAALGIPRGDGRLVALASDYALAVRINRVGEVHNDYHTIQSQNSDRTESLRPTTRAQELSVCTGPDNTRERDLNTTLTFREYVHDAKYKIFVVRMVDNPVYTPNEIIEALKDPVYPLSAGRRSCLVGRVLASIASLDEILTATHWDQRIALGKPVLMVKERRDQLIGNRVFETRFECLANEEWSNHGYFS